MRLEDDVNLAISALSCGGQRSANFGGMMAIVVDHSNPIHRPAQLKTPIDAAEIFEGFADLRNRNIEADADRDCRSRIEYVVKTTNVKPEFTEVIAEIFHFKNAWRWGWLPCRCCG